MLCIQGNTVIMYTDLMVTMPESAIFHESLLLGLICINTLSARYIERNLSFTLETSDDTGMYACV